MRSKIVQNIIKYLITTSLILIACGTGYAAGIVDLQLPKTVRTLEIKGTLHDIRGVLLFYNSDRVYEFTQHGQSWLRTRPNTNEEAARPLNTIKETSERKTDNGLHRRYEEIEKSIPPISLIASRGPMANGGVRVTTREFDLYYFQDSPRREEHQLITLDYYFYGQDNDGYILRYNDQFFYPEELEPGKSIIDKVTLVSRR